MNNKDLIIHSRETMRDLWNLNSGLLMEHEQSAYNCLRLLCDRLEQADELATKWKDLEEKISKFYEDESEGQLGNIGEVAASAFGFL